MKLWYLPAINAVLNSASAILLIFAYRAIRRKNTEKHKKLMIAAYCLSILFLISYLVHKWLLWTYTGSYNTRFTGEGAWRVFYFVILATHVILASVLPVIASATLFFGLKMNVRRHRVIARITLPIWFYVSVTGVLTYFMLYQWFAA